jgi:hypothetical protein
MSDVMWKARAESALSGVGRDVNELARQAKAYLAGLDTTERLVLLGLVAIGLFYFVLVYFQRREDEEKAGGHFMGLMFVLVALAAGAGWTISGLSA